MIETLGPPTQLLLTAGEAARMMRISPRKLWALTAAAEIPCVRIGRSVRYAPSALSQWIKDRMEGGQ